MACHLICAYHDEHDTKQCRTDLPTFPSSKPGEISLCSPQESILPLNVFYIRRTRHSKRTAKLRLGPDLEGPSTNVWSSALCLWFQRFQSSSSVGLYCQRYFTP